MVAPAPAGGREGSALRPVAPAGARASSPATRGGWDRPITVDRGATYRSLTHRSSASLVGSKKRMGERTERTGSSRPPGMSAAGPSTHPRAVRPWNGTDTRLPIPAPASSGSRYVNGRSSVSFGTATQTSTGPARTSGGWVTPGAP